MRNKLSTEREGLRSSNLVHRRSRKTCISYNTSAVISKVKGQGRKVTWCAWQVLADKSRTKNPSNTKIGRKVVYPTGNNAKQFQGQRSRSPGRHNVETGSASYVPNGRPTNFKLSVQMEDEDPYRRDGPSVTSKSKDLCWPISLERKVSETVSNYLLLSK